jgi:acyl-CoA thioester hydrolase
MDVPAAALGRFEGPEHRFVLRVYFEDTDLTGVVYHANYLRYLERARSDMLLAAGVDQRATWERGEGAYAIRDVGLRFRAPLRLGDEVLILSRLTGLRPAAVVIQQRVMRGEMIVAEATVEAAFVSTAGRPRRQPADWLTTIEPYLCKGF